MDSQRRCWSQDFVVHSTGGKVLPGQGSRTKAMGVPRDVPGPPQGCLWWNRHEEVWERRAGDGSRLLLACVLPPCWSMSHRWYTEVSLSHCPHYLPSGCDLFSSQRTWFTDFLPTNWSSLLGSRTWGFVNLLLISMHLLIQKLLTEWMVCAESCVGF